ncbi:MAG: CCA tRNA nucleotidyltransferase [Hyphomicrobiaceae bacterium]|nr:CCA tRNA nucleotidyltransferase [Hyphomicrobiaceae bacterium]
MTHQAPGTGPAAAKSPPALTGAAWLTAPPAAAVLHVLTENGGAARVVGGAVRNALMGLPVIDIDIATPLPPQEVIARAARAGLTAHPTGLAHGTVTLVAQHVPFEVTTLRRDVETFGRHATVAFTDDWSADAARRDFSMNALYCDPDGTVHDPLGGYPDLAARRVRFIGDAEERIREDYLRILRFFRFHATYGRGAVDPAGLAAAVARKEGLATLSAERVRSEVLKLLVADGAGPAATAMDDAGIASLVIGGPVDPGRLVRLAEIEAHLGRQPDAMARLAALAATPPFDADPLASRLRLSASECRRLAEAMAGVSAPLSPTDGEEANRAALYRAGPAAFIARALLAWAASDAPVAASDWNDLVRLPERWTAPFFPVTGADVIALGIAPGPSVGRVLRDVEAWWIAAGFPADGPHLRATLARFAATAAAG